VSYVTLPKNVEVNGSIQYVGRLNAEIDAYTRLDIGATWRPLSVIEFGVWGQNLLDAEHVEFFALSSPMRAAIPRSVVAQVTWRPRF
jgi:outer membrane receptor protein involved in Fe transport